VSDKAAATKTALAPAEPEDVFEQFDRIYNKIARRAFEIFERDGHYAGHELEDWFKAESEILHPVKLNMKETDEAVKVEAEVPGFTEKDLEVRIEPRRLTISGKRETNEEKKKGKVIWQEHSSNEILRAVDLPAEVETDKVTAALKNGMLELAMPKTTKSQEDKARRVEVKAA
jgi:HSP20 family protein